MTGLWITRPDGWVRRPHGWVRHYAGLMGPAGMTASRVMHTRVAVPFLETYLRNVTIHIGRSHARAIIPHVLELMADGRLRPELVTTQVAVVDDAVPALDQHCRDGAIKTILTAS